MKNVILTILAISTLFLTGCNGVKRLLGHEDIGKGTEYVPPTGSFATPYYDQATATAAQDDNFLFRVIGASTTATLQHFIQVRTNPSWGPSIYDNLNGIHNMGANHKGYSNMEVDGWKALVRRGHLDIGRLTTPSIVTSNSYPVPVYQDDPTRWGL